MSSTCHVLVLCSLDIDFYHTNKFFWVIRVDQSLVLYVVSCGCLPFCSWPWYMSVLLFMIHHVFIYAITAIFTLYLQTPDFQHCMDRKNNWTDILQLITYLWLKFRTYDSLYWRAESFSNRSKHFGCLTLLIEDFPQCNSLHLQNFRIEIVQERNISEKKKFNIYTFTHRYSLEHIINMTSYFKPLFKNWN